MWDEIAVVLEAHGLWGLLVLAFAESSFFPLLVPDFLLIPLCLARPERALLFALLCTVASVIGACFGYFLGQTFGKPLLRRLVSQPTLGSIEKVFGRYGGGAVLVAALIPLPFKLFTIASGCFALKLPRFLLGALVGRGVRFCGEAILIMVMGMRAVVFIKENAIWLTAVVATAIIGIYLLAKYGRRLGQLLGINSK